MTFDGYLAMTAAEILGCDTLPSRLAYMSCHFSSYGLGLCNLPRQLSPGSLLMLNDRTPIYRHDPERVAEQLADTVERFSCSGVLLDFQRTGADEVVKAVAGTLSCPVCVTTDYAPLTAGAVLLPPVPPDTPPEAWLAPWADREVWLEASFSPMTVTVTPEGAERTPLPWWEAPPDGQQDAGLFCHYAIALQEDAARFTLFRTETDLEALLQAASALGVTQTVGLYQEIPPQI